MTESILAGRHVLIVEDEYMIAAAFALELEDDGALVVGPSPTVTHAMDLLAQTELLDLAVLDANVRGEAIYPIADLLNERGVPFVLVTGYDRQSIPSRFQERPILEKPVEAAVVVSALRDLATLYSRNGVTLPVKRL